MVHSVSGWTCGVQVKLWEPLRTHATPERLSGMFLTRRYTNPHLPYLIICDMGNLLLSHGLSRPLCVWVSSSWQWTDRWMGVQCVIWVLTSAVLVIPGAASERTNRKRSTYGVENWKNNVVLKCLEIWQLSGKCRKTDQKSEKCCDRKIDRKSFVMENCLLLASRLELCQCLVTPFVHVRYTVEYDVLSQLG